MVMSGVHRNEVFELVGVTRIDLPLQGGMA
jgi:hypothetical protein